MRHIFTVSACLLTVACQGTPEPSVRGVPPRNPAIEQQQEPQRPQKRRRAYSRARARSDVPTPPSLAPKEEAKSRGLPNTPKAELSRKLEAAFGDPLVCLGDFDATEPMRVAIDVNAVVSTSGVVTRATVSGRGISSTSLKCLTRRAESLTLGSVRLDGPTAVSAVIEADYQPAVLEVSSRDPDDIYIMPLQPGQERVSGPAGKDVTGPAGKGVTGPKGVGVTGPAGKGVTGPAGKDVTGPKGVPVTGY